VQLFADVDAGNETEYVGHVVHAAEPLLALYSFATHATHGPPSGPVYPALHRQLATDVAPAELDESVGHAAQGADPVPALYVPVAHARPDQ